MENDQYLQHPQSHEGDYLSIFIISDSLGDTAAALVSAVMSQFDERNQVERLPKVTSIEQVEEFLEARIQADEREVVFFTITDPQIRREVSSYVAKLGISAVDLLGPAIDAIVAATGKRPALKPGMNRELDEAYFRRIEAMDYSVDHDDGRSPEDYKDADMVLIGVSRSSKTPLSMYLATRGYKVANLPLAPGMTPPKQIFDVDKWRLFGLMTSPTVLADIRSRRLGEVAMQVAKNYANEEYIIQDLDEARAFMRKLGCIIVRTDNRAIEETAQEILRYYEIGLENEKKKHG